MFIVFCGIDGSGKTTQLNLTEAWMRKMKLDVEILGSVSEDKVFFNSYLRLRQLVKQNRQCNFSECGKILMAFELFKRCPLIETFLSQGRIVLSHRWIYSHQAYARNESTIVTQILNSCLHPDLVLYFDIDPTTAINRIKGRGEQSEFESYDILNSAREKFLRISQINDYFVVIDGKKCIEDIFEIVKYHIKRLSRHKNQFRLEDESSESPI